MSSAQGNGGSNPCGVVRSPLQPAADGREKGHRPFCVPHSFARRFIHIGSRFVSIPDGQCLRGPISVRPGLKINISGVTK
jgi:hypothetical protein